MEDSGEALRIRENDDDDDDDDKKRILPENTFLPLDLVLLVIVHLPSLQLFDLRRICKAAHQRVLLALANRPFFVVQRNPPSSLCHLLPLDVPCAPLPCSFNFAKPSFRLHSGSGNLLCFHRQYAHLLDICVCNVFRKWKCVLPPIVHPGFAPHISRSVLCEDVNVESLHLAGFHAARLPLDTDEEGVFSPGYRIFVAGNAYLRVFDAHVNQWSAPVHFPSSLIAPRRIKPPLGFATAEGNLILTFPSKSPVLFNYDDQSFHAMESTLPHPAFEIAGYLASAELDPSSDESFELRVRLSHVEECARSSTKRGLVLKGLCKRDVEMPYAGGTAVLIDGVQHEHYYSRMLQRSVCYAYEGKLYVLVLERDEMRCYTEEPKEKIKYLVGADEDPELDDVSRCTSTRCEGKQWHDLHLLDVEKCLLPDEDAAFDCADFFPACSPYKLTLYIAHIDTRDWTLKVSKDADALASLEVFDRNRGTFAFMGC